MGEEEKVLVHRLLATYLPAYLPTYLHTNIHFTCPGESAHISNLNLALCSHVTDSLIRLEVTRALGPAH